ncbi:RadC family protein [Psychrobacter ciconiae]|uniref:RadC family protein n=1 Tax=Psychrobacter ciconiae TaxID=1553449 RepID=UPI001918FA30|nr:DNA repair protein RadC [Psychrobacter ciconiae]
MAIKDWHEDDRPREKLLKLGAASLSDAEILAIFLRTGTAKLSAIDLARHLIEQFGSLSNLLAAPKDHVLACHGIGIAKYAQIMASLEMGVRYLDGQLKSGQHFAESSMVKDYLRAKLAREPREVFAVMCLDDALGLIHFEVLFTGGISSCSVCIKHVLRHAISHSASQLIVAHNHPKTSAHPSDADDHLTHQLKAACELIDLTLLDHIIVGCGDVLSYKELNRAPF